jgi:hypothetical protein
LLRGFCSSRFLSDASSARLVTCDMAVSSFYQDDLLTLSYHEKGRKREKFL